jgi:hypothetical protein
MHNPSQFTLEAGRIEFGGPYITFVMLCWGTLKSIHRKPIYPAIFGAWVSSFQLTPAYNKQIDGE